MLQLATTVPAAILADLLGIHTTTAADWAHAAGGDWSHYAAEIARDQTSYRRRRADGQLMNDTTRGVKSP